MRDPVSGCFLSQAEKTRPYILVLVTGTRVYYVQARSDSERTEWMHIITATATAARQLALADDGAERYPWWDLFSRRGLPEEGSISTAGSLYVGEGNRGGIYG